MRELPVATQVYTGPVNINGGANASRTETINVNITATASTNGSGVYNVVFDTTSFTAATEWSTYWTNLYQEYRVLAIQARYEPYYRAGSPAVVATTPPVVGAVAISHQTGGSGASNLAALIENPTYKTWHLMKPVSHTWKMSGSDEAQFIPIGNTFNSGNIQFNASGAAVSTVYGRWFVRTTVQLRGRA